MGDVCCIHARVHTESRPRSTENTLCEITQASPRSVTDDNCREKKPHYDWSLDEQGQRPVEANVNDRKETQRQGQHDITTQGSLRKRRKIGEAQAYEGTRHLYSTYPNQSRVSSERVRERRHDSCTRMPTTCRGTSQSNQRKDREVSDIRTILHVEKHGLWVRRHDNEVLSNS